MSREKTGRYANISGKDGRRKRKNLLLRDGNFCWICGLEFDLLITDPNHPMSITLDHVITKKDGGTNKLENLKLAHRICNGTRDQCNL